MIHIQRPLPFILASTNIGTMIVNHLDKCETPNGAYGVGYQFLQTGFTESMFYKPVLLKKDFTNQFHR